MAPLLHCSRLRKVLLFSLLASALLASSFCFVFSESQQSVQPRRVFLRRRNLLANDDGFLGEVVPRKNKVLISDDHSEEDDLLVKKKSSETNVKKKKLSTTTTTLNEDEKQLEKKKKSSSTLSVTTSSSKNQTKAIKPKTEANSSKKDETKLVKPSISTSSKNKTKLTKPTSKMDDDSSSNNPKITKLKLNKVNSTSKSSNPIKTSANKPLDSLKSSQSDKSDQKDLKQVKSQNQDQKQNLKSSQSDKSDKKDSNQHKNQSQIQKQKQKQNSPSPPSWIYQSGEDDEEDLVSEFRNLPTKFHQSFIPDLHRMSTTSKVYLTKYNKEITKGFKPYFGNKYSSTVATAISFLFLLLPLLILSLIFNRIKAYFSLQKLIIFIQIYLSIYFSILCFSSLITGLESLRFFYATSQTTYVWLQILQTLAYVFYLLLLLMYLVLVFSTESDLGQKFLALAQTFVGFAVGLHYYMTVFHRVVLRQPPKSSWKFHGIYATCFLVICLFAGAERRKKVYLVEGSEEGKTS